MKTIRINTFYMEQVVSIVVLATFVYIVLKMIETKYFHKEMKPLKDVVRDSVFVGVAVAIAGVFTFAMNSELKTFMNTITEAPILSTEATKVFTDNPGF